MLFKNLKNEYLCVRLRVFCSIFAAYFYFSGFLLCPTAGQRSPLSPSTSFSSKVVQSGQNYLVVKINLVKIQFNITKGYLKTEAHNISHNQEGYLLTHLRGTQQILSLNTISHLTCTQTHIICTCPHFVIRVFFQMFLQISSEVVA